MTFEEITKQAMEEIDIATEQKINVRTTMTIHALVEKWKKDIKNAVPKGGVDVVIDDVLVDIGKNIVEQDNRITSHPIFVVEEKRQIGPIEDYYHHDGYEWFDTEDTENTPSETRCRRLDVLDDNYREYKTYKKWRYQEIWKLCTVCFTEEGCKQYLRQNGHNLSEPRINVYSAYRNHEWQYIRKMLIEQHELKSKKS